MAERRVGVVLVNLGTPAEPTLPAVRRYLREFLLDQRVVTLPRLLWQPLLETHIMLFHARRSAQKYASVWTPEGSPLMVHARAQVAALSQRLGESYQVVLAMRYGQPSLANVLAGLHDEGLRRVLVVPMYPQFSTTTVATVLDALANYAKGAYDQFEYRTLRDFHNHPGYIEACAKRIEESWETEGRPNFSAGEKLLLSYHGIPVKMAQIGDPYPQECMETTALLRERLGLSADECEMTYQSKFGHAEWLTPATIERVEQLGKTGLSRLDVFCPGFAADCLETEEEIGILNRETFDHAGGQRFVRIPCLNASAPFITVLEDLVKRHTAGWLPEG
ncbi:MAG: ferrochelatase [Propionibacteriaceae bacterium]|jgi:ferrochelatase|nr:ferrochelatase [Propionibacteriaceae bacterium]